MKELILNEIIDTIKNEDVKKFVNDSCIPSLNKYFFEASASSSFKYHPSYACSQPYGLAKHTLAVVRFLNFFFEVESISNQFTDREKDLMRVAAMMHDSMKSGTQEDYEKSKWTKFNHPLLAANLIRNLEGLNTEDKEFIAHCIESHMGAWNTDKRHKDIILPKPVDKYQIILHLADYLSSRKCLEMKFDGLETIIPEIIPNPEDVYIQAKDYKIPFGKYKDMTISEVAENDLDYLKWMGDKIDPGNTKTMVNIFLKEYGKKDEKV